MRDYKTSYKIMIQSVENIHKTYAKALIVDRKSLKKFQQDEDIIMS
ncbi:unnamed protein product, partial [marine sediment metagenome]